jgi:hypothetical protein
MPRFLMVLCLLSATVSTATVAAEPQHGGTDAEQKACAKDVQKFCRPVMDQNDLIILSCLKDNRPKLTKDCNQVLVSHGQ